MSGITDLNTLLSSISPELQAGEFVFCTIPPETASPYGLNPVATFIEQEGTTLVLRRSEAESTRLSFTGTFRQITLKAHSSLEAVGLTAAVASTLTQKGISANVIAAYYHDHIFVPAARAEDAINALLELAAQSAMPD